jgi:hypothetical protein
MIQGLAELGFSADKIKGTGVESRELNCGELEELESAECGRRSVESEEVGTGGSGARKGTDSAGWDLDSIESKVAE